MTSLNSAQSNIKQPAKLTTAQIQNIITQALSHQYQRLFDGQSQAGTDGSFYSANLNGKVSYVTVESPGNPNEKIEPGIVLHADKTVDIEHAVKVMDIAYRNNYKLVLATNPK